MRLLFGMNGAWRILVAVALLRGAALADVTTWTPIPESSTLSFTATQQGAHFEGLFERFSATIQFDADNPDTGSIIAGVETGSVNTLSPERDEYLRDPDWFDIARFPLARFASTRIEPRPDGTFSAAGKLTVRDQTRPATIEFTFEPPAPGDTVARFRGNVTVNRLDFGVGQGLWSNTDWVGAGVRLDIDLALRPGLP